jgi:signal transduction histidine kinase
MIGVLKNTALTQEQKEYVETVESSGEALLDLVNDILDFSKIGTLAPLNLPRTIFLRESATFSLPPCLFLF